ncbi:MAG: YidC/Oxa1 family membrane protein insertase [Desulfovibrionaceae bacterium]|nr:YidC/Oxa1 family membrane protein insertase [Desulfovibrionaceae bacterium]
MSWLYTFTIYPLELIYKNIYILCVGLSGSYGAGLIALSLCTFFAISPLKRAVSGIVAQEHDIQNVLAPQLKKIREECKGAERQARIQRLFRRYGYHPVMAVRSALGVALQIPFLLAAYFMVEGLEILRGQSFLFLRDLSRPDALLGGINLLPLVMTAINLATIFTSTDMRRKDTIQAIAVAMLFLALLYAAPSALLLYWTFNNILYLLMNVRAFAAAVTAVENFAGTILTAQCLLSPALTLPLALLAGPLFMWSHNWHMYAWGELGFALATVAGSALLLGATGLLPRLGAKSRAGAALLCLALSILVVQGGYTFFHAEFRNLIPTGQLRLFAKLACIVLIFFLLHAGMRCLIFASTRGAGARLAMNFLLCVAAVEIVAFFLDFLIRTTVQTSGGLIALHAGAIALCSLIVWRFGPGFLNIILLIFLCISTISTAEDIAMDKLNSENTPLLRTMPLITLAEKPNIYLFYMESTHGFDILENIFHMDTTYFQKFLENNGFKIYHDIFSDAGSTLSSMFTVSTMQNFDVGIKGASDAAQKIRSTLAGDEDNVLLATMKANGYHTVHLLMLSSYFFTEPKGNLDESDVRIPARRLRPLRELNPLLITQWGQYAINHKFSGTLPERVHQAMMEGLERKQPLFLIFKGGSEHTPWLREKYTYRQRAEWVASGVYQRHLEQGFQDAESIITDILENDPHSIIILMGDHGSYRLRYIDDGVEPGNLSELARALEAEGESLESYAKDMFGILLAIHMPDGARDISYGYPISPVNIFRHVFATINKDLSLLKDRVPQQSGRNPTLVIEGIVQEPERLMPKDGDGGQDAK